MQIGMKAASCPYCPSKAKALAASTETVQAQESGSCQGCNDSISLSPAANELLKGGCCHG